MPGVCSPSRSVVSKNLTMRGIVAHSCPVVTSRTAKLALERQSDDPISPLVVQAQVVELDDDFNDLPNTVSLLCDDEHAGTMLTRRKIHEEVREMIVHGGSIVRHQNQAELFRPLKHLRITEMQRSSIFCREKRQPR